MAIGDVIGPDDGQWFFDTDGSGLRSLQFPTREWAAKAGATFAEEVAKGCEAANRVKEDPDAAKANEGGGGGVPSSVDIAHWPVSRGGAADDRGSH